MDNTTIQQEPIHWGHFRAILLVAVLLLGFTWMKNPQIFSSLKFSQSSKQTGSGEVVAYVPYSGPAADEQPAVLGASTDSGGPMIINEDGSVTSAADNGQVLAASTDPNTIQELQDISVAEISDSPTALENYLNTVQGVEGTLISDDEFVQALSSKDTSQINKEIPKIQAIISSLKKLPTPQAAVTLQKNKILQYQAALVILQNFSNPDGDAVLLNQALQDFIQTQDTIISETTKLTSSLTPDNAPN